MIEILLLPADASKPHLIRRGPGDVGIDDTIEQARQLSHEPHWREVQVHVDAVPVARFLMRHPLPDNDRATCKTCATMGM